MNIVFLIGNGFDINLNLNTSYSGFYDFLSQKYLNDDSVPEMEKKIIKSIESDKSKPKEEKLWSDFEMGLGQFTTKITVDEIEEFNDARLGLKEKLAEYLKQVSSNLKLLSDKTSFTTSFSQSVDKFYNEFSPKDRNTISARLKPNETINYDFITFNYTDSLEIIVKRGCESSKVVGYHTFSSNKRDHTIGTIVHIHGTHANRMILGVDNASQIVNKELQTNQDLMHTFVKPIINSDCGSLEDERAKKILEKSSIFIVFGMSYGATDKCWWKLICQLMLKDASRYLLLFEINSKCSQMHLEAEYKLKNETIKKFFNGLDLTDEQKKQIRPRILIAFNSPRMFKLAEPSDNNEKEQETEEATEISGDSKKEMLV